MYREMTPKHTQIKEIHPKIKRSPIIGKVEKKQQFKCFSPESWGSS